MTKGEVHWHLTTHLWRCPMTTVCYQCVFNHVSSVLPLLHLKHPTPRFESSVRCWQNLPRIISNHIICHMYCVSYEVLSAEGFKQEVRQVFKFNEISICSCKHDCMVESMHGIVVRCCWEWNLFIVPGVAEFVACFHSSNLVREINIDAMKWSWPAD